VHEFVADVRDLGVMPHMVQNHRKRRSAIDARTTRHVGYEISPRKRKRVGWMFTFATAIYNLVRIRNLAAEAA
jgi:hypothetical protein